MVKIFKEAVKGPVGGKRQGDVKTAVVRNEKVIVKVVDKVGNHGKAFAFHDDKGANHGVVGKAFPSGFGIWRNGRQVEVKEKGIVKFGDRLRGKKPDVVNDFLTVDSNQPPLWRILCW